MRQINRDKLVCALCTICLVDKENIDERKESENKRVFSNLIWEKLKKKNLDKKIR